MKITIDTTPKEIAALLLEIETRQESNQLCKPLYGRQYESAYGVVLNVKHALSKDIIERVKKECKDFNAEQLKAVTEMFSNSKPLVSNHNSLKANDGNS